MRLAWGSILKQAAKIVLSYDTGVTLRQLFYRLVAAQMLPNKRSAYSRLSELTAEGRRQGTFPALVDQTRIIHRDLSFSGPAEARDWLARIYRRDRTEGQEWLVYIGVEKATMVNQLRAWFGNYGVRIVALRGYSSQTYVDDIAEDAAGDGRPAVLIYAGDFDPSGVDIDRDLEDRCSVFDEIHRVALNEEQIGQYELPESIGKETDSRAAAFRERYGRLVQVEIEALAPEDLRQLFAEALSPFMDLSIFKEALNREEEDRRVLQVK